MSREKIDGKTLAEIKELTEFRLGKGNEEAIGEHAAGTLKAKSVTVDGGQEFNGGAARWRVLYEWEPVS